ncbi:hypothetical protein BQ8482_90081 [Mesorhizobium delmotii]|uniref:Uncharacterized protein n=1 Tax=Mesorhizobium delmotii TaxID=1631247 RepID=A0A2P9AX58_9HYPH|nr:hypothetical protein BQ8482_90081 [Mesorhizobium delmotii]
MSVSGLEGSKLWGRNFFDAAEQAALDRAEAENREMIRYAMPTEEVARWNKIAAQPLWDAWVKKNGSQGPRGGSTDSRSHRRDVERLTVAGSQSETTPRRKFILQEADVRHDATFPRHDRFWTNRDVAAALRAHARLRRRHRDRNHDAADQRRRRLSLFFEQPDPDRLRAHREILDDRGNLSRPALRISRRSLRPGDLSGGSAFAVAAIDC